MLEPIPNAVIFLKDSMTADNTLLREIVNSALHGGYLTQNQNALRYEATELINPSMGELGAELPTIILEYLKIASDLLKEGGAVTGLYFLIKEKIVPELKLLIKKEKIAEKSAEVKELEKIVEHLSRLTKEDFEK